MSALSHEALAFVDLETTGANPLRDRITEIGLVLVHNGQVESWSSLVNPGMRGAEAGIRNKSSSICPGNRGADDGNRTRVFSLGS